MTRREPKYVQRTLDDYGRGGPRPGSGRPKSKDAGVPHTRRERFKSCHPLHVTIKLKKGLPGLRQGPEFATLCKSFELGRKREGCRLVHFAVLGDHLHLVVEAEGHEQLSKGVGGLMVSMAKRLNRLWRREGSVFADRYHSRSLKTPREVRHALCYVLNNARKHGLRLPPGCPDPFSSASCFTGWDAEPTAPADPRIARLLRAARTWLLNVGWCRVWGPIPLDAYAPS